MGKQVAVPALWLAVEAAIFLWRRPPLTAENIGLSLFFGACLVWVCTADSLRAKIPNIAVALIAAGGVVALFLGPEGLLYQWLYQALVVTGFMILLTIAISVSTKRRAFGAGDIKLLGAGTLWVGAIGLYAAVMGAFFAALVFALAGRIGGFFKAGQPVPVGPFISIALWVVWLEQLGA